METKDLETSLDFYKILDNPLFQGVTIEVMLHTMMIFTSAEDLFDSLMYMVDNHDSPFYFTEVREKLKDLHESLLKEGK
jgi:hypothetical protein